jgi:4-oxalomesaconate tautomerase
MTNSDSLCQVTVQTPNGQVEYAGQTPVDGVPGTAAPIVCNYLNVAGSATGALLPTGSVLDVVDGLELTCIDNGMPVVIMRAADLNRTGYESVEDLNADTDLKTRLESIRLRIGPRMNLGDVTEQTVPKMCLIAPPLHGGLIHTRTFIPHVCHDAIGVLGAVSVATACLLPGSVAAGMAVPPLDQRRGLSVEHPSGEFSVDLQVRKQGESLVVEKSGVLRTARLLSKGELFIPAGIWDAK